MRLDKWLWAARFFKTRSLAAEACDMGRIDVDGRSAKPAREVKAGAMLRIRAHGSDYEVRVLALSEIRGPAAVAQGLYEETVASKAAREKAAEDRRLGLVPEWDREGRPSKKNRREIDRLRDRLGY